MKDDFTIRQITKAQAASLLLEYHYLKDISRGFKSGYNYGLFLGDDTLVGVCIFTGFPVPELATGMLGLDRSDQGGLFELSRLCLLPSVQETEHNIASWFVSRAIKRLRQDTHVRVVLSYADSDFHGGIVYQACNFKYYGLSDARKDFFIRQPDGSFIKHSRGKTRGIDGEWRQRSQKHRYVIVFDRKLKVLWEEVKRSKRATCDSSSGGCHDV